MNNTQKLIIAQRKLIKYLRTGFWNNQIVKKFENRIAKLEKKIIKEENNENN